MKKTIVRQKNNSEFSCQINYICKLSKNKFVSSGLLGWHHINLAIMPMHKIIKETVGQIMFNLEK